MKKSRFTRILSLFAAVMMVVSLLSTVALASDAGIQPRLASCPECGGGRYMSQEREETYDDSWSVSCSKSGVHYTAKQYRIMLCEDFNSRERVLYATGYYCTNGCGRGFHWNRYV